VLAQAEIKIPKIQGEYIHIYKPAGDTFAGPDEAGLKAGKFYDEWVPNDHCFARDDRGRWHAFGITHPRTDVNNVHAGENQSFHAIAPVGSFRDVLRAETWKDLPKVLTPGMRPDEIRANHAPHIIRKDGQYRMIYGPTPLRYAVSEDLHTWIPKGQLSDAPAGRDPCVFLRNGLYHILVCGNRSVSMATTKDLVNCRDTQSILTMKDGVDPESPSMVRCHGTFYLFVCAWNGQWDKKDLTGAYQHITYVYQSDDPFRFDASKEVTRLNAHAPEIFQDEQGHWYISSAQWPNRGVSVARLVWE